MSTPVRLQRARLNGAKRRRHASRPSRTWSDTFWVCWGCFKTFWNGIKSLLWNFVSVVLIVSIFSVFWKTLTTPATEISEFSLPKSLAERGYSSNGIAALLKDRIVKIIRDARSHRQSGVVTIITPTRVDVEDIKIPGFDLSLSAIEYWIRGFVSLAPYWVVSGELTEGANNFSIHMRMWNGTDNRSYDGEIAKIDGIEGLLSGAAQAVLKEINPNLLAVSYLDSHIDQAEELASSVVSDSQSSPDDVARAHIILSHIYYRKQLYAKAYSEADAALLINRKLPDAHVNRAAALHMLGDSEDALGDCIEATREDKTLAIAYNNIGLILVEKGRTAEAEVQFDRAVKSDSTQPIPHYNFGIFLKNEREWGKAEAEFRHYILLQPKDGDGYYALGIVLEEQGKFKGAEVIYRKILDLGNYLDNYSIVSVTTRVRLAILADQQGQHEK